MLQQLCLRLQPRPRLRLHGQRRPQSAAGASADADRRCGNRTDRADYRGRPVDAGLCWLVLCVASTDHHSIGLPAGLPTDPAAGLPTDLSVATNDHGSDTLHTDTQLATSIEPIDHGRRNVLLTLIVAFGPEARSGGITKRRGDFR